MCLERKIKKVLIIRSCRMSQFNSNLATLKENIGQDIAVDVLTDVLIQPEVEEELRANKEINEVMVYNKGYFKVKDIPQELWPKIRRGYDGFVILYANPYWRGYYQINEIAVLSKAKYIIGVDIDERIFITPYHLWWLKRLWRYFIAIATLIFTPIFLTRGFIDYGVSKIQKLLLFRKAFQGVDKQRLHNRMRILYFGLIESIHLRKWMKFFVNKGHEIHLISILPIGNFDMQGVNLHILKPTSMPLPWISPLINSLIGILPFLRRLKKLIKKINPDVLHLHRITPCSLTFTLANLHPFILTAWDVNFLIDAKGSRVSSWITKFVLKNSDLITCDAEHVRDSLVELGVGLQKIKLINFGIDTQKFTPGYKDNKLLEKLGIVDGPKIISLRQFAPIYNVDSLIMAIPLVLKEISEAKFIIAGYGPEEPKLRKLANSLGVSKSIRFVGRIPNDELPLYLRSVDIYVSTSLSDAGIAASTAEAMACGLPVIITDFGDNRKWVEDGVNGFIVPMKSPEALASKIIYLINNRESRERFGRVNRQIIEERNDWKKEMEKMEELYKGLIKDRGGKA